MPLLNIFGDIERLISEDLYPYRYVITPLLIAAALGALYVAYRLGAHLWVRRNPVMSAAIGVPLVVVSLVAGNYLLSPLWERSFLEEASPLAVLTPEASATVPTAVDAAAPSPTTAPAGPAPTATTTTQAEPTSAAVQPTAEPTVAVVQPTAEPTAPSFQPAIVYSGSFVGADSFHFGEGTAQIIETAPGVYVLRFEDFSVRNGPDLFVYLSEDPTGESVDEALNLGALKATDGAFNYEIPPGIDVSRMKSAVVWCRQFTVLFAHAELG